MRVGVVPNKQRGVATAAARRDRNFSSKVPESRLIPLLEHVLLSRVPFQISKQHATQQGSLHARANRGIKSAPRTWQKRSKVLSQRNGDMHSHIKPGCENLNCAEINRSQRKDFCPAVADAYLVVALLYRKSWRCTFVANSAPGGRFDIPKCLIGRSASCRPVT